MTNKIVRFLKTSLVTIVATQIILTSNVFAYSNITIHSVQDSINTIVKNEDGKLALSQTWYGSAFILNQNSTYKKGSKTKSLQAVNSSIYQKALEDVKCDLSVIGQYDVYFLNTKLADYSNVAALSFTDNSAVVFGTEQKLSNSKINTIAVHELGHNVDFKLMNETKWNEYKRIRGIEDSSIYNNNSSVYSDRPQEIFAEDFRMIMGGTVAAKEKHLNQNLPNPKDNPELVQFFEDLMK